MLSDQPQDVAASCPRVKIAPHSFNYHLPTRGRQLGAGLALLKKARRMWPMSRENCSHWLMSVGVIGLMIGFMLGRIFPARYIPVNVNGGVMIFNANTGNIVGVYGSGTDSLGRNLLNEKAK